MKTCGRCKKRKPATEFFTDRGKRSGLQSYCKVCKRKPGVVQLKLWDALEQPTPDLTYEFRHFLFLLTLPYNKQLVYKETSRLSIYEQIILIQMNRQKNNEWRQAA